MGQEILSALDSAWTHFLGLLVRFVPRLLAMLVIVAAGWVVAWIAGALVRRVLRIKRVHALLERGGTAELLRRADAPTPERLLGAVVFWLVWLAFLLAGMQALGVGGMELLVTDVMRFLPRLVAAGFIVVVGVAVANFLWRATLVAAVNAGVPSARVVGGLVRALALAAAIAMALEQIDLGQQVVQALLIIAFGAVMLAGAIAFGLGGRDLARRVLEQRFVRRDAAPPGEDDDEPPHV